ncbi:MAG: GrdX family protein [Lachnoclostridium sp.]
MRTPYIVVTNNPLVVQNLENSREIIYKDVSYEGILQETRDRIHKGHVLLTHPLSGSVKPNETPYKSILISQQRGDVDADSLKLIENAIQACRKFVMKADKYKPEVYQDFQLIDWTLLESAMASADTL